MHIGLLTSLLHARAPPTQLCMPFNKDDLADGGRVALHVQAQLPSWKELPSTSIHVKDFSASGGARVYKIWQDANEEVKPAAVIMKAEGDTGDDDEADEDFHDLLPHRRGLGSAE